ncbi:LytR/AlgR family response regulator transcription factor [Natronoflexus pectinivorans]|uniref:LytTR family two component transcriptional regulator n=1 Tax=Natronoflexus pectinivorans TaxID=682526 RepID=A0A4R2GLE3_9BACT|nr:LytTR family DNA-binding domain-containing protein [Natronoflexus pectinivorans]TCO09804.1 LytTR family two component transcriptional regulator [Natronoflexus pectinivorans]
MQTIKTTVLIAEDEIPTQRLLKGMIEKIRPDWEIVIATTAVEETVEWLQSHPHPDLMFLDIQLSDGISFEIFDQTEVNSMIIFTTAYDEYAIQAFKVNSIDYLLKPVRPENLKSAIEKFEKLKASQIHTTNITDIKDLAYALTEGKKTFRSRILVPAIDGYTKLKIADVAWFHSSQKVTTAVTFDGTHHIIDLPLEKLEDELNPSYFYRANRQYIINIEIIHKIENWFNGKLIVKTRPETPEKIVVSRERARSFKEWINQ